MTKVIPRIQFDIDETNPSMGVKVMSLVDEPAIESNFIFLNKQNRNKFIELKNTKFKQIVAGLALIPNKDILRIDASGEPYYGVFSEDVIEKIRTKFHREQLTNRVNTDHSSTNYVDAFLIESFIIDSDERLADVKAKGIEEAVIGSWFVSYKIESPEVFKKVIEGELNGFSVEVFLTELYKKENNTQVNAFEKVMNKFLEKLKALLSEMESAPVQVENPKEESKKLESGKTAEGQTLEYGEVGEPANLDGKPAADGSYTLDNKNIVVVASGIATEIKDAEEAPVEQSKPEVKLGSSVYATYQLKDGRNASVSVSNLNEVSFFDGEKNEKAVSGEYELKDGGFVQDGKFVQVKDSAEAKAFDELQKANTDRETLRAEIVKLKAEVEKLKQVPLAKPVTKAELKSEIVDESKLSNADLIRRKLKIK